MSKHVKGSNAALLADWSMAIARFIVDISPQPGIDEQLFDSILAARARGDIRGLKMLARDMTEWGTTLSDHQRQQLDRELLLRFGATLESGVSSADSQLRRILVEGVLRDEDDYRIALQHVENIYAEPSSARETARLNDMLAAYHGRAVRKDS